MVFFMFRQVWSTNTQQVFQEYQIRGHTMLLVNIKLIDVSALVFPNTVNARDYWLMFNKCSNLTYGPILPATTLTTYCYYKMFVDCSTLTTLTCEATDITSTGCLSYWLDGVTSSGTLYVTSSMVSTYQNLSGSYAIPQNWTVASI